MIPTKTLLTLLTHPYRMLAITPLAARTMVPEEVRKICMDYPLVGIEALRKLPRGKDGKPLRFVYASGAMTERDQTKKPWMLADYVLMRVRLYTSLHGQKKKKKKRKIS